MDYFENIQIEVTIRLPWAPSPVCKRLELSRETFGALEPLPRGREVPWDFEERRIAIQQAKERELHYEVLKSKLAAIIEEAVRSRDPQNGYSPEEWAKMNRK